MRFTELNKTAYVAHNDTAFLPCQPVMTDSGVPWGGYAMGADDAGGRALEYLQTTKLCVAAAKEIVHYADLAISMLEQGITLPAWCMMYVMNGREAISSVVHHGMAMGPAGELEHEAIHQLMEIREYGARVADELAPGLALNPVARPELHAWAQMLLFKSRYYVSTVGHYLETRMRHDGIAGFGCQGRRCSAKWVPPHPGNAAFR